MKYIKLTFASILIFTFFSCSTNDDQNNTPLELATSQICENIIGPTAIYWDYGHGLPTPLTQIPTLANPGQQFIHSEYPALGVIMPQGYNAVQNQAGIGVNVIRDDNQAVWRYVPGLTAFNEVPILDVVAAEINQLFAFYNFTGDFEVVCTENATINQGSFVSNSSSRLLRFGNITAVVIVNTHFDASLGSTFASISTSSGPTAEYDNLVMEVFLPLTWQLLVIDDGVRDSDLDGTPDEQDNFPFDPSRQ